MPAKKFTAKWVESLQPPEDRERWFDASRLGTGQALVLSNNKKSKTWAASYYLNGRSMPMLTVGRYNSRGNGVDTLHTVTGG